MPSLRRIAATTAAALILGAVASLPLLKPIHAHAATAAGGTYHPLTPARILDTRNGTGGFPVAPLGQGATIDVQVAGQGGVPAANLGAVVVNATATDTTAPGYLTIFPTGVPMPLASNLNWVPGQTVPNLVTVGVGSGGKVSVYNGWGSVNVVFDVEGYYSTPAASPGPDGLFNPIVPSRLVDTRIGNGAPAAPLAAAQTLNVQVAGRGGVPANGVSAVVMNFTVTNPTTPSFLTVFPAGKTMPLASNLNFRAGQTVPNRVIVALGAGGQVSVYNGYGSTDLVVDVNGWFTDSSPGGLGSRFTPLTPARIVDSRYGTGGQFSPWGPNTGRAIAVAGQGGVPQLTDPNPPTAAVLNVTVTDTTAPSALIAWPDGAAQPLASDLNWVTGTTVPNLAVVKVGPTGKVDLFNLYGCVNVVVDVVGWFTGPASAIAPAAPPTANPCPSFTKGWLARLNYWRFTAGLPPLTENPTWSQGDYNHSLYMVKDQLVTHYETPGQPYYTPEGDTAARNGNIEVNSFTSFTDDQAIDFWMQAPFHALGMMDPRLSSTGFGAYREARSGWAAGFTLDVLRGNSFSGGTYPVTWPANGMTVPLRSYGGGEFPDPLQACPGYTVPTGLPVFIQVGGNIGTTAGPVHAFTANGVPLEHCVIDSTNPAVGSGLAYRGAVIVIPRQPLQPGVAYVVTLTVNGVPRTWTFQVS